MAHGSSDDGVRIVVTIYTVFSIAVFHVAGANFVTAGNALSGTKTIR